MSLKTQTLKKDSKTQIRYVTEKIVNILLEIHIVSIYIENSKWHSTLLKTQIL